MARKSSRNTKARIVSAAWKLFYEQGYEETTVEEIIFESETSKGSFYHYFDGKDALLSSLSVLFDERYEELMQQPHDEMDCIELLSWLNQELFTTIENTVSIELLARLFSSQLAPNRLSGAGARGADRHAYRERDRQGLRDVRARADV